MAAKKKILIVGVGSIGERHTRCFLQTGLANVSICEINHALRRQVADRYGIERTFETLDHALDQPFDAAVICTPAHLHVPMAIQLAEAGIHLLIEKPLSTSLDQVQQLCQLVRQRNLSAMVAYVLRADPILASMRAAIRSGRFGEPIQLVAVAGQHFPTYRPAYRDIYYSQRQTGGGAIQDALTHVINAGQWLVGPVARLTADAKHQVLEGVDVEDTVHVLTRQANALCSYSLNQHQAANESTITVICRQGMARFESHLRRWQSISQPDAAWQEEMHLPLQRDQLFVLQAECFLKLLGGNSLPLCTLDEAIHTLHVNLAILDSWHRGCWQTV